MDFKKITGLTDYSIIANQLENPLKELRKLTYFQITNVVAKVNPIVDYEISLTEVVEYAEKNKETFSCKYNSIKKSGLNLKCPGRNVSYLLFKSGKVSFIGLKIEDIWSDLSELTSEKSKDILLQINDRIKEEIKHFRKIIENCIKIDPQRELTYEITNLFWDLVNVYNVDILRLAKEYRNEINFDPEIFIAASYKPFKKENESGLSTYKGSFNIFSSKRIVYTGSKSVEEFEEASERLIKILLPYSKIPKEEDYDKLIKHELKIKLENRLKRKNKIPGKRGRRPRVPIKEE